MMSWTTQKDCTPSAAVAADAADCINTDRKLDAQDIQREAQDVMPCVSFNHGNGRGDGPSNFLAQYVNSLPRLPQGVVVVEAHVEADPVELVGDAELVKTVASLLQRQRISTRVHRNPNYTMGHGAYDAKRGLNGFGVPIVTVSLRSGQNAADHLAMGAALAPLRREGILLLGSGLPSFHNFHFMMSNDKSFRAGIIQEAIQFDRWLLETMSCEPQERWNRLSAWEQAPGAYACHPFGEVEHFLPTLVLAGASQDSQCRPVGKASHKEILPKLSMEIPLHHFDFRP